MIGYFQAAERYHWTPDQYDELPLDFALELPHMIAGADLAAEASRPKPSPGQVNGQAGQLYGGGMAG